MTLSADNVSDYADTLVLQARGQNHVLDYSLASLASLEAVFRISDDLLHEARLPDAQRNIILFYGGCYLGETLSRAYGGVWQFDTNWFESTMIFSAADKGIQIRPFHKIYQRVVDGPTDNDLVAYADGLKNRLASG